MSMTFQLTDAAHFHGFDNYFAFSPSQEQAELGTPVSIATSWGPGTLATGEAGELLIQWSRGFDTVLNLTGDYGGAVISSGALYEGADAIWTASGSTYLPWQSLLAGAEYDQLAESGDTVVGNSFGNLLRGPGGSNAIIGNGGGDAVILPGSIYQYTYTQSAGIVSTSGPDGVDSLAGISRIYFDDHALAFDVHGTAGEAFRLYQAAFARSPDLGGLGFHIASLDRGASLVDVAQGFVASPEFQAKYGTLNDSAFVTQMYANVLHRAPETSGYAFWMQDLHAGDSRASVLADFSESPENQANVIGSIDHGMIYDPLG